MAQPGYVSFEKKGGSIVGQLVKCLGCKGACLIGGVVWSCVVGKRRKFNHDDGFAGKMLACVFLSWTWSMIFLQPLNATSYDWVRHYM